jgi:thymidylate synthase (FAD)
MKIVPQSASLLRYTPDAIALIATAGHVCYQAESKTQDEAFVTSLINRGHESVIEHASATFSIITDRGVTHELVRHRLVSYSQESTRFCNYANNKFGNEITVIEPPGLNDIQRSRWRSAMSESEVQYCALIADGVKPQIARSVLPTCLKTQIITTANFREWRHILKLRTSLAAHPQMRELMEIIKNILVLHWPCVFAESLTQETK